MSGSSNVLWWWLFLFSGFLRTGRRRERGPKGTRNSRTGCSRWASSSVSSCHAHDFVCRPGLCVPAKVTSAPISSSCATERTDIYIILVNVPPVRVLPHSSQRRIASYSRHSWLSQVSWDNDSERQTNPPWSLHAAAALLPPTMLRFKTWVCLNPVRSKGVGTVYKVT